MKNRNLAQLKNKLKRNMGKNLKEKENSSQYEKFSKAASLQKFVMSARVLEGGNTVVSKARWHQMH